MAMTDVRKFLNRLNFGPEGEDEYRETGKGYGMLGVGTGKVKLQVKDNKMSLSKKQKKGLARHMGGGGAAGGLASDLCVRQFLLSLHIHRADIYDKSLSTGSRCAVLSAAHGENSN